MIELRNLMGESHFLTLGDVIRIVGGEVLFFARDGEQLYQRGDTAVTFTAPSCVVTLESCQQLATLIAKLSSCNGVYRGELKDNGFNFGVF